MEKETLPVSLISGTEPPYNFFLGSLYLCWLTGSIAYDSIFGKSKDLLMIFIFGSLFLIFFYLILSNLNKIIFRNKIGIKIFSGKLIYTAPKIFGIAEITIELSERSEVFLNNEILTIKDGKTEYHISTSSLLDDPEWILKAVKYNIPGSEEQKIIKNKLNELDELKGKFVPVSCRSCGGNIEIKFHGNGEIVCEFCGGKNTLPEKIVDSLKKLSLIIRDLPENLRRFKEKSFGKFINNSLKYRKRIVISGWITFSFWIVMATVEILESVLREKMMNKPFVIVSIILALFSIISAILLSKILKGRIIKFSSGYGSGIAELKGGKPEAACRMCGSELKGDDLIRRCEYCGTDSMVTGDIITKKTTKAKEALEFAKFRSMRSFESGIKSITNAAWKLIMIVTTQFFWLHIPILVFLDGHPGMLFRLTPLFLLFIPGTIINLYQNIQKAGLNPDKK
ncbi:MAG: hypothetical protein ABFR75_02780 [Acidobacteriota bacterium]